MEKQKHQFSVVNLSQQDIPIASEDLKTRYDWVPFGIYQQDDFYNVITDAYNTSTTNAAVIEGLADLMYGKGVYSEREELQLVLDKVIKQRDYKKLFFDYKLYGNGALQVYWNDDHTKIVKMYHTPVRNYRAEKLVSSSRIENYYYCTNWDDVRAVKQKKTIPAFGTSNEKMEILWFKNYSPGYYYYSLPDWLPALQFSIIEAELSNLHLNAIDNGFMPMVMLNFNNGIPAPEERERIEGSVSHKFTGSRNANRFMLSFNDDPDRKPTIDVIQSDNLHDKYQYAAEYAQDRILVAHKVTSPLLFGIRTATNGFSSQSEEMKTAFSILQTMVVNPLQNVILETLRDALEDGGYEDPQLFIEQLTPLAILSETAEDTDQSIEEVEEDIQDTMENPDQDIEDDGYNFGEDDARPFHPLNKINYK
jgi:hypothetical protein